MRGEPDVPGLFPISLRGTAVHRRAANAVATTFDTSSPGVLFSVYDVNYYVRSFQILPGTSIPGLDASSYISGSDFDLSAGGGT